MTSYIAAYRRGGGNPHRRSFVLPVPPSALDPFGSFRIGFIKSHFHVLSMASWILAHKRFYKTQKLRQLDRSYYNTGFLRLPDSTGELNTKDGITAQHGFACRDPKGESHREANLPQAKLPGAQERLDLSSRLRNTAGPTAGRSSFKKHVSIDRQKSRNLALINKGLRDLARQGFLTG